MELSGQWPLVVAESEPDPPVLPRQERAWSPRQPQPRPSPRWNLLFPLQPENPKYYRDNICNRKEHIIS